jgi:p-hydroxybenzoate 3-monooxygenase
MRTQVGIVGAGPAGLTLALLLKQRGIDAVILELRDRTYVEQRVRAGLLEHNTVELFRALGVASRLDREGLIHDGIYLRREGQTLRIPITDLTGRTVTVYGQQEVVKDLMASVRASPTRGARPIVSWSATTSLVATAFTASHVRRSRRPSGLSTSMSIRSPGSGFSRRPSPRPTS